MPADFSLNAWSKAIQDGQYFGYGSDGMAVGHKVLSSGGVVRDDHHCIQGKALGPSFKSKDKPLQRH